MGILSSTFLNHLPPLLKEDKHEQGSIAVPSSLVIATIQHNSNHQLLKTQMGFLHHMHIDKAQKIVTHAKSHFQ